jgi:hypothetical protein
MARTKMTARMIAFVSPTVAGTDGSRESDVENDKSDQDAQQAGTK